MREENGDTIAYAAIRMLSELGKILVLTEGKRAATNRISTWTPFCNMPDLMGCCEWSVHLVSLCTLFHPRSFQFWVDLDNQTYILNLDHIYIMKQLMDKCYKYNLLFAMHSSNTRRLLTAASTLGHIKISVAVALMFSEIKIFFVISCLRQRLRRL